MKILFTGGGTGGHLMPIIAVAEQIKLLLNAAGEKHEFLFIGPDSFFNEAVVNFGMPVKKIRAYKLRRYWSVKTITEFINLPIGIIQSLWHVYWFMPDAVFAKGGYASFPVVFAAWVYRIPVIIHESDSVAGVANIISSKFANKVAIAYESAGAFFPSKKIVLTGNPIRKEILEGNKEKAREEFSLKNGLPVIFVIGGSQGSQKINEILLQAVQKIVAKAQIIHQCGIENYEEIREETAGWSMPHFENYRVIPFLRENIKDAYAACDIIVSRAGANSISEIVAAGKPSILIPLPTSASDHQLKNAYYFSSRGAAIMLEEENLTPNLLYDTIFGVLENKEKQMQMIRAARALVMPDAAKNIAEEIIKLGK